MWRLFRPISSGILIKAVSLLVSLALIISTTPLASAHSNEAGTWNLLSLFSQNQRHTSSQRPPEGVFPNLDEMRRLTDDRRRYGAPTPSVPAPIPSTRRRWRQDRLGVANKNIPSGAAKVDFNALLAFQSPPSSPDVPWLTKLESRSSSPSPFLSSNRYAGHEIIDVALNVAALPLSPQSPSNFATARLDPQNRTGRPGVDLLSKNFNWSLDLVGLRGRSGLDLGLSLAYNSKVWTKSGNYIDFDLDEGTPAPGFRLGFPTVQGSYYNDQAGAYFYMLITPSGHRLELRKIGASNVYQTVDASYAQLTDNGSNLVFRADGAQLTLVPSGGEYHCTEVKDRNGNYLTITYNGVGDIATVTDTLGRVLNFNYDGNANLISITQTWGGQAHTWATFGYGVTNVGHNFPTLTSYGPDNVYITVLNQVGLPDGSRYNFEYHNYYGMVSEIRHHAADGHERRRTSYSFDGSTTDCPRVTAQREWAENWNGDFNGVYATNEEAVTNFGVDGSACTMTLTNGVIYKEFYGTGWQAGLTTQSEVWSGGIKRRWTTYGWTQDNTGVSYLLNPRLIETNVNDVEGNRKRATISYSPPAYAAYSLPYEVIEYANDGVTMLRRTYTDYNVSSTYTDRRIIGLVIAVHVVDHATGAYVSKTTFDYDWGGEYLAGLSPAPIRHDGGNYGVGFVAGRGNLTSVWRWDATDINNGSKAIAVRRTGYNITGAATFVRDALDHQTSIAYTDSYSDSVNRNTYAYPTTLTDADNSQSTTQYNFDFGAVTRTEGPPPAGQAQGAITTMTYDAAARIQWVVNQNNGAWKYIAYADRGDAVMSQETINAAPLSYWKITVVDGANRLRLSGGDHPGSSGTYAGAFTYYDVMGRVSQQSNPAETNAYWSPTGDDSAGWNSTYQTYDWQDRPLVTTNPDGTTREASYGGCGCAGGAVVTLTDEGTLDAGVAKRRQQKIYSDVLGRTLKTEMLNWQGGSVYSATVNTYNSRDQITQVRQYAGAEGSGTYQDTTISYDGYGRVKTKHIPEQDASTATVWDYNPDNTVQKTTDARGASQSFSYNNRHLVTNVSYAVPGGSTIPVPASASFAYDAAGNRTSMTDGLGSMSYVYDSLSRLTSESRVLTGVGTYALSYGYNLAGAVTSITDPFGTQVGYVHDSLGRVTSVTGANFGGVSSYASDFNYRASGALKDLDYGNGRSLSLTYNARLQPSSFTVPGVISKTYDYYSDGRLKFSHDLINPVFDRSYANDHTARITEALSGAEARQEGTTNLRPYKQSFSYDGFGHLIARPINQMWSSAGGEFSPTQQSYQNGRNLDWEYDADGNLIDSGDVQYTIDAAGRTGTVDSLTLTTYSGHPDEDVWGASADVTQSFDGDGQVIKKVTVDSTHYFSQPDSVITKTTYLLYSSALGGKVVTEFESATLRRGYVYLGGETLAWQKVSGATQTVQWQHQDPGNASFRLTSSTGTINNAEKGELDPLGTNAGATDQRALPSAFKFAFYPGFASAGMSSDSSCVVDGVPTPCSEASWLMSIGAAGQCPSNNCGPRYNPKRDGHGRGGWERPRLGPNGFFNEPIGPSTRPALTKPTLKPKSPRPDVGPDRNPDNVGDDEGEGRQETGPNVDDLQGRIGRMVSDSGCAKFISDLINGTATAKNPAQFTSASMGFARIKAQGGFIYGDTVKKAYGFDGATVHGSISGNNAQVELPFPIPFRSFGPVNQRAAGAYGESQARIQAGNALHEILHLAGKNGYDDFAYANTVASMRGVKPPDFSGLAYRDAARKASEFWGHALGAACKPR